MSPEELLSASDLNKTPENIGLGSTGMSAPKKPHSDMANWEGSYVYYGKFTAKINGKTITISVNVK